VLVTRRWPDRCETAISEAFDATFNRDDVPLGQEQLAAALHEYDAVLPTVSDALPAALFGGKPFRTKVLANFGVGVNHIALDAARGAGIIVTNTPGVLTDATADIAMMLILMVARRASEGARELRAGAWTGWRPTHLIGTALAGLTLGVVGAGRIGLATAERARAFGMKIVLYNRSPVSAGAMAALDATQVASLEALIEASNVISLHVPGGGGNRHLFGATEFDRVNPGTILVNTARGDVLDEEALLASLASGKLGGAGLDVFQNEPALDQRLLDPPNLVLLPHLGSATATTREAMGMMAFENARAVLSGGEALNPC